ncbi:MAG: DUF4262 domain-containing protein [Verrucomicrobiota bacterium]
MPITDYAAEVRKNVAEHGFHVTYVGRGDSPAFCYSTGIWETYSIPEIFVSSLPPNLSHELISQYIKRYTHEAPAINEQVAAIDERFDYYLIPAQAERLEDYVLASLKFYGDRPFEYLQLVYPDTKNRFPHESGYNYDQEILGEFSPL